MHTYWSFRARFLCRNICVWLLLVPLFAGHSVWAVQNPEYLQPNPLINVYTPEAYAGNGQNWDIAQDSSGLIYAANSGGVILQFDGRRWQHIPVGNGSIVRCVEPFGNGFVTGLQNDLGYLSRQADGSFNYRSFVHRFNRTHRRFGDVWQVVVSDSVFWFLERQHLMGIPVSATVDTTFRVQLVEAQKRFHSMYRLPDARLLVQQREVGLMQLQDTTLRLLPGGRAFKDDLLAGVHALNHDSLLVITRQRGLFRVAADGGLQIYKTDCTELLQRAHLYQSRVLRDGNLALASKFGGLFILNPAGKLLYHLDAGSGLPDNTVWSVYEDLDGDLWLATNEGIARIQYTQPFHFAGAHEGLKGSVHGIQRFNDQLYVTTNYGLWREVRDTKNGHIQFESVPGIPTAGWGMLRAGSNLFIAANSGIYRMQKERAVLVYTCDPWTLLQSKTNPNLLYVGLAKGVDYLRLDDHGRIIGSGHVPGLNMEARTLTETSDGELWVASSYQGAQRTSGLKAYFSGKSDPLVEEFGANDGLPAETSTLIFQISGRIFFSTIHGIFQFNESKKRFVPARQFAELNALKVNSKTYMLCTADGDSLVWSHVGSKLILNRLTRAGSFHIEEKQFRGLPDIELQFVFPEGDGTVWFGHRKGLIRYHSRQKVMPRIRRKTLISEVLQNGERQPIAAVGSNTSLSPRVKYKAAHVWRFQFGLPIFVQSTKTEFRYQLQGFDSDWSAWSLEDRKDYTNLPPGDYRFAVQGRDVFGNVYPQAAFKFHILPLWYQGTWFWLIIILTAILMLSLAAGWLVYWTRARAALAHHRAEVRRRQTEDLIRKQVAADFHDELGTRITRISLFSEILKNELGQISDISMQYLQKIALNADRLYDETRDFIWQLDPERDRLQDFSSRIKIFAEELFEGTGITFYFYQELADKGGQRLGMELRRNLIRISKEALHNALKYAQCNKINLYITVSGNILQCRITDDGIGLETGQPHQGTGLENMRRRAERIGGKFSVSSNVPRGTQVEVEVAI